MYPSHVRVTAAVFLYIRIRYVRRGSGVVRHLCQRATLMRCMIKISRLSYRDTGFAKSEKSCLLELE